MAKTFHYNKPFELEQGGSLPSLDIAYDTWGQLNASKSNVAWVCHALTANSDVADWWPGTMDSGRFLDPSKQFIVCANILGSCYGTTGPASINPSTGMPWCDDFPRITVRDMVHAHQLLARHLGISRINTLIGSSIGGFQCLEWCIMQPDFINKAVLIATSPHATPWAVAFNESQRMALRLDPSWGKHDLQAGNQGLAVARSIAMLSYRGPMAYNATQADDESKANDACFERRVITYQWHQGEKLSSRFNAYSYYRLTQAFDSHNVGRNRGGIDAALSQVKARCLVVAITSDLLFPASENKELACCLPCATYEVIDSKFGHDGFLVEANKLNAIITQFIANT